MAYFAKWRSVPRWSIFRWVSLTVKLFGSAFSGQLVSDLDGERGGSAFSAVLMNIFENFLDWDFSFAVAV